MSKKRYHYPRERAGAAAIPPKLTRTAAIVQMLQLALDEMARADLEEDEKIRDERWKLAQRMVVDAKAAVIRLEVKA